MSGTFAQAQLDLLDKGSDETSLLARPEEDGAISVADNGKNPISDRDRSAVTGRVEASFAARIGAMLHIPIKPVRQMNDLPEALQFTSRRQNFGNFGNGVFLDVVQDAHRRLEEVRTTMSHELYDHAGAMSQLDGQSRTMWPTEQIQPLGRYGYFRSRP